MVVARLTVLCFFFVFAGLLIARDQMKSESARLEKAWAAKLHATSPERMKKLRQMLLDQGAILQREGATTKVVFEGSQARYVALINNILSEPVEWNSWSCDKQSTNEIRGILYLKNL